MEIQLEQLVLFESGEMLFSWVKSEGRVCISPEREVFFPKLNTRSQAIASNRLRQKSTSAPWSSVIYPYLYDRVEINHDYQPPHELPA